MTRTNAGAMRPRRTSRGQAGLGLLGDLAERRKVVHREIREDLAVHRDVGLLEAGDQAAVRQPELARRCVDADDPQRAELPLALLAADVRVLVCLGDGLLRDAEDLAAGVVVALRLGNDLLVATTRRDALLYTCHGCGSLKVRQHAGDATCVFRSHVVGRTKAALTLGRLLREDVALERVAGLELAARGLSE